jgi:uncharacterized protein YndB with AHSA1/START domain
VVEVSVDVDATPEQVYALVSDLPRMGEWSPECYRCTWAGGATAAAPGAKFKGYNRRGFRRWTTTGTVVTAEPGQELSFDVHSVFDLPVARWTYRIEPTGNGGSRITEQWEDRRSGVMKVLGNIASGVSDRAEHNREGMRQTLARIKETAEA